MSAQSTGFISGAVSGAAIGSSWGLVGAAVGGIAGGLFGGFSGSQTDDSFAASQEISAYNAQKQYEISMSNISMYSDLAEFNASMELANAAKQVGYIQDIAEYNADLIEATVTYNNSLLDQDIGEIWEELDLDLSQLENARAVERGEIRAQQGASGTVIDEGSNADVMIDSKAQEAMDAFILRRGADVAVMDINNEKAQSIWKGQVAIQQTIWEGEIASSTVAQNALSSAGGTLLTSMANTISGTASAELALISGLAGVEQRSDAYDATNTNNFMASLFGAASFFGNRYYNSKDAEADVVKKSTPVSSASETNYQRALASSSSWERGLSVPGSSLLD